MEHINEVCVINRTFWLVQIYNNTIRYSVHRQHNNSQRHIKIQHTNERLHSKKDVLSTWHSSGTESSCTDRHSFGDFPFYNTAAIFNTIAQHKNILKSDLQNVGLQVTDLHIFVVLSVNLLIFISNLLPHAHKVIRFKEEKCIPDTLVPWNFVNFETAFSMSWSCILLF